MSYTEHPKVEVSMKLNPDMLDLLEEIRKQYRLRDTSKVVRVLLDYVAEEGDRDAIFKPIRCKRCDAVETAEGRQ